MKRSDEWMNEKSELTEAWCICITRIHFVFILYSTCGAKKATAGKTALSKPGKSGCNALQTLSREPTRVRTRRRHKSTKNEGEWRLLKQGGWRMFLF